jgi:uncharacterized protein involved in exopolysaccharide biosynthesis
MTQLTDPSYTEPFDSHHPDGRPRVTVVGAALRHWVLVLLPMLALMGVAAFIGLARAPVYTAKARMNVGRIDVSSPGALAGFSTATESLAASYSRAVDAEGVVNAVSRQTGLSPNLVDRRTDATPVPTSPVFVISARGLSATSAIRLANTTSTALIEYLTLLNRANPDSDRLFKQFQDSAIAVQERVNTRDRLQKSAGPILSASEERTLAEAQARVEAAVLRRESLRSLYQSSLGGQSTTSLLQVLSSARRASSDRSTRLQLLLFLAAAAGLLVGLALATFRASRLIARAMPR